MQDTKADKREIDRHREGERQKKKQTNKLTETDTATVSDAKNETRSGIAQRPTDTEGQRLSVSKTKNEIRLPEAFQLKTSLVFLTNSRIS